MAALLKTNNTGCGMHIDVSQREVTTLAVGEIVAAASLLGVDDDFPGNGDLNAWLQDILPVADGWLCITVPADTQAHALSDLLNCERADLVSELRAWLAGKDSQSAIASLRRIGIAAFRANTGSEAAEAPSITSGEAFSNTPSGKMVKGFPFQFAHSPLSIYAESPGMGEHTDELLRILEASQ